MADRATRGAAPPLRSHVVALREAPEPEPTITAARPAGPATAEVAQTTATYQVQPGDSLWDIADRCLHDPLQWRSIWELNRGRVITDSDGGQPCSTTPS